MIKEILGFTDFPVDGRYPTLELLGKGLITNINPGASSANVSFAIAHDGRRWLRNTGSANPSVRVTLGQVGITDAEMKARKVYGGFRYIIPANAASLSTDSILRIVKSGATTQTMLLENHLTTPRDEAFIEYCIDLPNQTWRVWIDGVLKNSGVFGNDWIASVADTRVEMGQGANAPTSEVHWYNDFYWVLDTSDVDQTPSKRLGPVKVGAVQVNAADIPDDWTIPDGHTAMTVLKTNTLGPNTETSPVIRTSATETVGTFGFDQPATEFPILAVSLELYGFRDTGTAPVLVSQLKQGEVLADPKQHHLDTSFLKEGANANRIGCLNLDLNNQPWTKEAVDALEIRINSKTGG